MPIAAACKVEIDSGSGTSHSEVIRARWANPPQYCSPTPQPFTVTRVADTTIAAATRRDRAGQIDAGHHRKAANDR